MASEEAEAVKCPDVYPQYKAMVDYYALEIMDDAQALMAVVNELGCESYQMTDGTYTVQINRTDSTKDEA